MAKKRKNDRLRRRDFLRKVTASGALAGTLGLPAAEEQFPSHSSAREMAGQAARTGAITYPRVFAGTT